MTFTELVSLKLGKHSTYLIRYFHELLEIRGKQAHSSSISYDYFLLYSFLLLYPQSTVYFVPTILYFLLGRTERKVSLSELGREPTLLRDFPSY